MIKVISEVPKPQPVLKTQVSLEDILVMYGLGVVLSMAIMKITEK
jgi:hypothetical protein